MNLEFNFTIPEGEVLTLDPSGWPGEEPRAVRTWVGANIDGVLYTPAGEFGGHYEETQLHPVTLSEISGIRIVEQAAAPDTPPVVGVAEPHSLLLGAMSLIGLALARG